MTATMIPPAHVGCSCGGAGRPALGRPPGAGRARRGDSGEYIVIGTDDRQQTTVTTDAPFRYICNLELNGWAMCSGTLVGPRTVLTAAHCLFSGAGTLQTASQLRVIPGRNGPLEPLPATRAVRLLPRPGFIPSVGPQCSATPQLDIGLVHLANPVGTRIGFWTRVYRQNRIGAFHDRTGTSMSSQLPMAAGRLPVNVSGYPADMRPEASFNCRDASGQPCRNSGLAPPRSQVECGTYNWRAFNLTMTLSGGLLRYQNDTCGGQSGSPVWVRRHPTMGGRVLVGVHIGCGTATLGNAAVHLNAAHLQWITANTI